VGWGGPGVSHRLREIYCIYEKVNKVLEGVLSMWKSIVPEKRVREITACTCSRLQCVIAWTFF
jgi:hypothetical protein